MNLDQLVAHAKVKDNFKTIQNYLDFTSYYLDFLSIPTHIQANIVSQNENHYRFIQYGRNGNFNITRPLNSNLFLSSANFDNSKDSFLRLLSNIRKEKNNTARLRSLVNKFVYTIQQSIGATLDALPSNDSNTARKINGDLFERLIRLIVSHVGLTCTTGVVQIPVKINGMIAFNMSYQHDLIIKSAGELKAIGSVKTSSKDRIDKIFIDKFLYNRLTETVIPHFAVFLNDVQRKNAKVEGQYGINSTFLPGHFKGYTIKLNPLDGVYYCDIRPNMLTEDILKDHIKTFDHLLFTDIWEFIEE